MGKCKEIPIFLGDIEIGDTDMIIISNDSYDSRFKDISDENHTVYRIKCDDYYIYLYNIEYNEIKVYKCNNAYESYSDIFNNDCEVICITTECLTCDLTKKWWFKEFISYEKL